MGLLTIVRKLKRKERQIRLLLVGLDNAGKTTVLRSVLGEDTSTVEPTLGFNIRTLPYKGFALNLWDVGGQKSIRAYWRNYFEETDGLVWVVDSADVLRLEDCRSVLHSLLLEERLAGASLLILANKQDLAGALTSDYISKFLDLETLAKGRRHVHLCGCSAVAKGGESGVMEGLEWLVDDISSRMYSFNQ